MKDLKKLEAEAMLVALKRGDARAALAIAVASLQTGSSA